MLVFIKKKKETEKKDGILLFFFVKKLIILFSNIKLIKVTVKTFIRLQKMLFRTFYSFTKNHQIIIK